MTIDDFLSWGQVVYPLCDEGHANRTASVLSGMTDTEHTTSGSNEKEACNQKVL